MTDLQSSIPTTAPAARNVVARRGVSMILATASFSAFVIAGSFAVDMGRVQLAKTELRRAADAAARAGALSLEVSPAQAKTDAIAWSKKNFVDGKALTDGSIAVTVGNWNASSRTFTASLSGTMTYNAVRVVLVKPSTGADSVPLFWSSLLGVKGVEIRGEAIAQFVPGENVNQQVDGVANPFLAGMPTGSVASLNNPHNSPDYAGNAASSLLSARKQSPMLVPLTVKPGQWIEFDNIAGTVKHDPNLDVYTPDGQLDDIGHNTNGSENGIGDVSAPINALVGVFLSDAKPSLTAAPSQNPDRTAETSTGRDQLTYSPPLKQIFFVGDGQTTSGVKQRFQVPAGATRLFLATWDFYEWNNNDGYRIVKVSRPGSVVLVK